MRDGKNLIAGVYDLAAAEFAENADRSVYSHLARPLALAMMAVDGVVLDVATGTGALGRRLRDAVGIDLSMGQLLHNPLALRMRGDAERLPFKNDSFAGAACAFGINHFPDPDRAVAEMARVAPVVGILTWTRPEEPYRPKQVVLEIIEKHAGTPRTEAGMLVETLASNVGSEEAITALLQRAGLVPAVAPVTVDVPWVGAEAFADYRLSMLGAWSLLNDPDVVRTEAIEALSALPPADLRWRPKLILGLGRRTAA